MISTHDELRALDEAIALLDAQAETYNRHGTAVVDAFKELKSRGIADLKANWAQWKQLTPSQRVLAGGERMRFFSLSLDFRPAKGGKALHINWRRGYFRKGTNGEPGKLIGAKYLAPNRVTRTYDRETLAKYVPEEYLSEVMAIEQQAAVLRQAQPALSKARLVLANRAAALRKRIDQDLPL